MNIFLPIIISYQNLTNYIVFNRIYFACSRFHYIKRLICANGSRGSSVIKVTRIEAVGYQAKKKKDFYFVLSFQKGTEAHIGFF